VARDFRLYRSCCRSLSDSAKWQTWLWGHPASWLIELTRLARAPALDREPSHSPSSFQLSHSLSVFPERRDLGYWVCWQCGSPWVTSTANMILIAHVHLHQHQRLSWTGLDHLNPPHRLHRSRQSASLQHWLADSPVASGKRWVKRSCPCSSQLNQPVHRGLQTGLHSTRLPPSRRSTAWPRSANEE